MSAGESGAVVCVDHLYVCLRSVACVEVRGVSGLVRMSGVVGYLSGDVSAIQVNPSIVVELSGSI